MAQVDTIAYTGEVWTDGRGYATVRLSIEAAPLEPPFEYELRDLDRPSTARVTGGPRRATRPSRLEDGEEQAVDRRNFVGGFLGSFAAVLAFNVVIDPFALAGTGAVPTAGTRSSASSAVAAPAPTTCCAWRDGAGCSTGRGRAGTTVEPNRLAALGYLDESDALLRLLICDLCRRGRDAREPCDVARRHRRPPRTTRRERAGGRRVSAPEQVPPARHRAASPAARPPRPFVDEVESAT